MRQRAYAYLDSQLGQPRADQRRLVACLHRVAGVRGQGARRRADATRTRTSTRLYGYRDRMPVFALAYLTDALVAKGEGQRRPRRRAAPPHRERRSCPKAASAHVEELNDPYLLWFWNSNVRSTAIVLEQLVRCRRDADTSLRPLVALADEARQEGRTLGQYAGKRHRDGIARRLLPQVRVGRTPTSPRWPHSATREIARDAVPRTLDRVRRRRTCRCRKCSPPGQAGGSQPLTFTRKAPARCSTPPGLRYAARSTVPGRASISGLRIDRSVCAVRGDAAARPAATTLQGRRSRCASR